MAGKNIAVYGIFADRMHVETGVDALVGNGFRKEDISILVADNVGTKDFAHELHSKAPEGAAVGGGTGAVIGGAFGLLIGLGVIAIPGLGPILAAGPVVAALARECSWAVNTPSRMISVCPSGSTASSSTE